MTPLPLGQRFGKLILVEEQPIERTWDGKRNQLVRKAAFLCDCGNKIILNFSNVRRGLTASCGCYHKEVCRELKTTHGMSNRPEYRIWEGMRKRCRNKLDPHYGGRGIRVSEKWEDFTVFYADMGPRPEGCEIDRINNDGNYEPGNCRWVTKTQNARNKSNNNRFVLNGISKTLSEWAEELGIEHTSLLERIEHWPLEEALTTPKQHAATKISSRRSRRVERSA